MLLFIHFELFDCLGPINPIAVTADCGTCSHVVNRICKVYMQ